MRQTKVATVFARGLICVQAGLVLFALAAVMARQPQLWTAETAAPTIVAVHTGDAIPAR